MMALFGFEMRGLKLEGAWLLCQVKRSYNEGLEDWRGYLLPAADRSRIALPPAAALREYYGA